MRILGIDPGLQRTRFRLLAADVFRYLGRPGDELACRKLAVRFPPGGLFADREGVWWFGEPFDAGRMLGFGLIWTALLLYSLEGWSHMRRAAKP